MFEHEHSSRTLSKILSSQWQEIRRLTYDYLDILEPANLSLVLPFPASQALGYQFPSRGKTNGHWLTTTMRVTGATRRSDPA